MSQLFTIAGIDQAIDNLSLNPETQKAKLITAIRGWFAGADDLETVREIAADDLVRALWGETDPASFKARRKSISSLKSSLNKSLKDLSAQGLNPEGLIVGRNNVFEVSEEQKKVLLERFGAGLGDAHLVEMAAALKKAFPEIIGDKGVEGLKDLFRELEQARGVIDELHGAIREKESQISDLQKKVKAISAGGYTASRGADGEEGLEEIDEAEVEEIEVDADAVLTEGVGEGLEEVDEAEVEEIEVDADAVLTEGGEEGLEEIDEEEIEEIEIDADAVLTVSGGGGGVEEGGGGGELGQADDIQEIDEDEFEEIEVDEGYNVSSGNVAPGVPQSKLLEVLSKYLEPDDVLQGRAETLVESEEGLVSQLLERFTPKFIKIPSGNYPFGCANPSPHEHPLQTVVVKEFYLGQYPVTNDLFELFVRETGYETDAEKAGYGSVYEGQWRSCRDPNTGLASFTISQSASARQVQGANWRHPSGPGSLLEQRHSHPVVQVSRRDATAFAAWAGKRLPTEEEWEAAARGPDGRLFPWGQGWDANRGNFSSSCLGDTTPVERYLDQGRSPFSIGDLLGNVYEWTAAIQQPMAASMRFVLKGGCWHSRGMLSVCHRRIEPETWSNIIGFRLAVTG